jgi:hypothetical protein
MSQSGSAPAQNFLPVVDIDHGVAVRKDGTLIAVLMVSATNLALKSPDEQQATMQAFQNFLNTIEFSIQIVVHSRSFDIRPYLQSLKDRLEVIPEELLRIQTAMYIEYVRTISETQNIMQKEFYVVVPYAGLGTGQSSPGGLRGIIDQASGLAGAQTESEMKARVSQLEQRVNVVIGGLGAIGLSVTPLNTEQLIELFYELYNPGDSVAGAASLVRDAGIK